jgi:molybdenum cofactor cytidylyltransferase
MNQSIAAVILSAGASRRMAEPKALLKVNGISFLQHIMCMLTAAGIRDTVIVLGAGRDTIQATLGWFGGRIAINDAWESGQLSSIITGIDALGGGTAGGRIGDADVSPGSGFDGILIWPVDHPLITAPIIGEMVRAFRESSKPIAVPVHQGRRGHPIILAHAVLNEVRTAPESIGLRSVVHAHEQEICEVQTNDPGVLINIDTPEDYHRYVLMRSVEGPEVH